MSRKWMVFVAAVVLSAMPRTAPAEMQGKFLVSPVVGAVYPIQFLKATNGGGAADFGFSGGGMFTYFVNDRIGVGGRFVYNRFDLDTPDALSGDATQTVDGSWTMLELGAFLTYMPRPHAPSAPYGRLGLLVGLAEQEINVTRGNTTTTRELDVDPAPGLEFAVGAMHEIATNVSVFGELGWTVLLTDGTTAEAARDGFVAEGELERPLQWLGVKGGVSFWFEPR